ncbi:hypothetical protein J6590_050489 [Homalodisca vitripennis]|nr:hypothetical protein J6590_050489 [Homalodisca vitripennis]
MHEMVDDKTGQYQIPRPVSGRQHSSMTPEWGQWGGPLHRQILRCCTCIGPVPPPGIIGLGARSLIIKESHPIIACYQYFRKDTKAPSIFHVSRRTSGDCSGFADKIPHLLAQVYMYWPSTTVRWEANGTSAAASSHHLACFVQTILSARSTLQYLNKPTLRKSARSRVVTSPRLLCPNNIVRSEYSTVLE